MGKDMLLSTSSLICMVIYYYSWQFRTTGLYFKDAAGMWQADFWKPYVSAFFNIVMNIVLVQIIGINGVFISTIVCMFGINFFWETIVLFRILFMRSPTKYICKELLNLLKTIVMCTVTYFMCLALPMQYGFSCIIFRILICIIFPNIIFIMSSFKTREFSFAVGKVKQIIQKRL